MKKILLLLLALALSLSLAACGGQDPDPKDQVAGKEDMTEVQEVGREDMEPITADQLKEGTYSIAVDSSSSMFNITDCQLTVADGQMTAVMTMGGTGYLKVYLGTGEEAAAADEADCIPFQETETGEHTFTVPVSALDEKIACAAFSKNKELWYDRTLVFRADSLPREAFAQGVIQTAADLGIQDGDYLVEVQLEGGSGRASVESPAQLTVKDGQATATIVWSSPNYDYMKVDDVQYDPIPVEGNSTFQIPVAGFDWKLPVLADTTAMSTPHEIEYTLYFDASTLEPAS